MNQSSHSRPILPKYNQFMGDGGSQRLPQYKQSHLTRYTPYCRYTSHPKFFCDDSVPGYVEALTPTRRAQNLQNVLQPQRIDPGKAERDRSALNDFFSSLSTLFVAPGEQGPNTEEEDDEVEIEN